MNPTSDNRTLWNNYLALKPDARFVADVFILVFEPVNYLQCETFLRNVKHEKYQPYFYRAHTILKKAGIFICDEHGNWSIHPFVAVHAFPDLMNEPSYKGAIETIRHFFSAKGLYFYGTISPSRYLRNYLFGYFYKESENMAQAVTEITPLVRELKDICLFMVYSHKYDEVLMSMPEPLPSSIINFTLEPYFYHFLGPDAALNLIAKHRELKPSGRDSVMSSFLPFFKLFDGKISEATAEAEGITSSIYAVYTRAIGLMYAGDLDVAAALFQNAFLWGKKAAKDKKYQPPDYILIYYLLLCIIQNQEGKTVSLEVFEKQFQKQEYVIYRLWMCYIYFATNRRYEADEILSELKKGYQNFYSLVQFLYLMLVYMLDGSLNASEKELADKLYDEALKGNLVLFAAELLFLKTENPSTGILSDPPVISRIKKNEGWEDMLTNLLAVSVNDQGKDKGADPVNRLIYLVDFESQFIKPVLQTRNKSGWSKGRDVSVKKLREGALSCMTKSDLEVAAALRQQNYYNDYFVEFDSVVPFLAGHPLLFLMDNPAIPVELVKSSPEIISEKTAGGYQLTCNIEDDGKPFVLKKETNTRYRIYLPTKEQRQLIKALNYKNVIVPAKAKDKLSKVLSQVSGIMNVQSDLSVNDDDVKLLDADPRIRVQLIPVGGSLKAEWFVKPFGTVPPYFKPGKGGKTVYGVLDNEKCASVRDLSKETENAQQLANALDEDAVHDFVNDIVVYDDPYECLSLLEGVKSQGDIAVLEWPEGEKFRFRKTVSFDQLKFKLNSRGDWFELDGEVRVDENTVLKLCELLQLNGASKGRFVEIGENEYLAFSAELKQRLNELSAFGSLKKDSVAVSRYASDLIEEITLRAGSVETDEAWKDFRKKVLESENRKYDVPHGFQAELRPYQEEGFRWMARLADLGTGVCLADDMGLGKTIQSLALLLHRAKGGAALVVCPASVLNNWVSEAAKFAPALNAKLLPANGREEFLQNVEPFDLFIITYGVLQTAIHLISAIQWETVILDEAHAIKNMNSKTSKAAMDINANFRIILTGTPVQNHLGELWSLFNFINPGLLGSFQHFNSKFNAGNNDNHNEKLLLKKLIAPFILRRTKTKVLEELPAKTEITNLVELSDDEMNYYEALRRQAILNIEGDNGPSGQKHLRALAEITKLRLACCNVALVDPALSLPSSKLEAFQEIVEELVENNHRALVFSQFVTHLALVRSVLEKKNIPYKYLDGSTPIPERGRLVKQFQEGECNLFLISLKAGGLGLNLTGADYVIHLDPWWNPAIEDQASDRAHRIGQVRPVTIYRLVAKNTIEEKIIKLHHTKRDMADSLLEGTDQASKLTSNDLLNLIKDF